MHLKTNKLLFDDYVNLPGYNATYNANRKIFLTDDDRLQVLRWSGRVNGLQDALARGYSFSDPLKQFGNVSFSFTDFLKLVLWTDELDMMDAHWMSYTQYCDPCRRKYNYILRLENIDEESTYLLQKVLGYPETTVLSAKHRIKGVTDSKSDLEYYKNVPKDVLTKIIKAFKIDFDLFDYKIDLLS